MSTIAQIVRQLIDQLSEQVSQLVLQVVDLQEQNAGVPSSLPPAVGQTMHTSTMLAKCAHQIATVNFKNYDSVANDIRSAADAVLSGNEIMTKAMDSMQKSDRKDAWLKLSEACRIMALNTIKLLQIVYAADLKRIYAVANSILKEIGDMDCAKALTNPDDFAAWASNLATQANQLAQYLSQRAKDEESPVTKAKLEDYASRLRASASNLIEHVNQLLDDPENTTLRQKTEGIARNLQALMGEIAIFLRETATEMTSITESDLPDLAAAIKQRLREREEEERRAREAAEEAERKRLEALKAARRAALASADMHGGVAVEALDRASALAREIARTRAALDRLRDAAMTGNAEGIVSAANEANSALEDLKRKAKEELEKTQDPLKRQHIVNSVKQMEQAFPDILSIANRLASDPTDADRAAIRKMALDATNYLKALEEATRELDLLERALRADRAADLIARAVSEKRSPDDRHVLGEDFAKLHDKVVHAANFQAHNAIHDSRRKAILDAIARLQMAAGALSNLAHLEDSTDPNALNAAAVANAAVEYKAALAALRAQANAAALGTLAAVLRDVDAIHRHALAENRTGIQASALQMIKDAKAALDAARKAANDPAWAENEDERKRLIGAIDEVDARLKDQMQAIRNYMETGTGPSQAAQRKEALLKVMGTERPLKDSIEYLDQILKGQVPEMEYMAPPGDEVAITKSAMEINEMVGQLYDLARAMKEANDGSLEAAKAQRELETLLANIQTESSAIIDALAAGDEDDKVVAKAAETVEYIRQLRSAAQGSPESLVAASKRLTKMVRELQSEMQGAIARSKNAENRSQLEAQSKAVGELMTEALLVTKSVISDGLASHKNQFDKKTHQLRRAVQRAAAIARPEDHDERIMRDSFANIEAALKALTDAANAKSQKDVESQLTDIDASGREYLRAAHKRKGKRKPNFIQRTDADQLAEFRAAAARIGHPARELAKGDKKEAAKLAQASLALRSAAAVNNEDNVVDKIAAFQDVDECMASIENGVEIGDNELVTNETKRLAQLLAKLPPIAEEEKDSTRKTQLRQAVADLQTAVRNAVVKAIDCIKNPSDENNMPALGAAIDAARVPSARAIALLSPCEDRTVGEILRKAQSIVSTSGPVAAAPVIQQAIDLTSVLASKDRDATKRRHIEQAVNNLQEKMETLAAPDTAATAMDVHETLDDLYHMLHTATKTDLVELAGTVKGGASEIQDDLQEAAKPGNHLNKPAFETKTTALGLKMEDLRDSALAVCRGAPMPPPLIPKGQAPDDLAAFVDAIEASHKPVGGYSKDVQQLLSDLRGHAKKAEPKTFEEALEKAAVDIAEAVQASSQAQNSPELIAGSNIAADMALLAKHARSGKKKEMLEASRQVAHHLQQMVNEINAVLKKMGNKNPNQADRLIRAAAAMKNFATQLKILCSVKAVSIEVDTDNDETLLSITNGLGKVVSESLQNLDTCKRVILKEK